MSTGDRWPHPTQLGLKLPYEAVERSLGDRGYLGGHRWVPAPRHEPGGELVRLLAPAVVAQLAPSEL